VHTSVCLALVYSRVKVALGDCVGIEFPFMCSPIAFSKVRPLCLSHHRSPTRLPSCKTCLRPCHDWSPALLFGVLFFPTACPQILRFLQRATTPRQLTAFTPFLEAFPLSLIRCTFRPFFFSLATRRRWSLSHSPTWMMFFSNHL